MRGRFNNVNYTISLTGIFINTLISTFNAIDNYIDNNRNSRILYYYTKNLLSWCGCMFLTLLLGGLSLTKNIIIMLHSKVFMIWDNYMNLVGRKRIITERSATNENGDDYLIRYYIFLKGSSDGTTRKFPFNIFIHKFLKSDDPIYHDHPWAYATLILSGGYKEHIPKKISITQDTDYLLANAQSTHEYVEIKDTYTDIIENQTPGSLHYRDSTWKHWIELNSTKDNHSPNTSSSPSPSPGSPCWTLFFATNKSTTQGLWGFYPYMGINNKNEVLENRYKLSNITSDNANENEFIPHDKYLQFIKKED